MMKRIVASAAVCAALALGSQAAAEEQVTRSTSVALAGVDFNDSAQVDKLYRQLKTSARKMCRGDTRSLSARADEGACRAAALDAAVKKAGREPLASRHTPVMARSGK